MTFDERCAVVVKLGFTERQARFVTTVMLHTGVCVPRQYARYCRIVHGQKTRKFFAKLVRLGYASMYDCRHNRAQLYHLNKRSLYAAIGEATSRLQRPLPLSQAIHRLMVLDAIVEDPDMVWLGTAEDKAAHLTGLTSIRPEELPHVTSGINGRRTVRYFPERLPIGIHLAGRGVLVYVVLDPTMNDFRLFLERHAAVLRALPGVDGACRDPDAASERPRRGTPGQAGVLHAARRARHPARQKSRESSSGSRTRGRKSTPSTSGRRTTT